MVFFVRRLSMLFKTSSAEPRSSTSIYGISVIFSA